MSPTVGYALHDLHVPDIETNRKVTVEGDGLSWS